MPEDNPQPPPRDGSATLFWVLIALLPTAFILASVDGLNGGPMFWPIVMVLNPAITIPACCLMLKKPGTQLAVSITGGVLLGVVFAGLNFFIGFLAGCALHPMRF